MAKSKKPATFDVDVDLSDGPGFDDLPLSPHWTVMTFMKLTLGQLTQLVEALRDIDPDARIEVTQFHSPGGWRIYCGRVDGCPAALMEVA